METIHEEAAMTHLPHIRNSWSIGTILASGTSILSFVGMVGSVIWFSAHADATIRVVPDLQKQQVINSEAIAVLQNQIHYTDIRFAEIQLELAKINEKLDYDHSYNKKR